MQQLCTVGKGKTVVLNNEIYQTGYRYNSGYVELYKQGTALKCCSGKEVEVVSEYFMPNQALDKDELSEEETILIRQALNYFSGLCEVNSNKVNQLKDRIRKSGYRMYLDITPQSGL